jgi:hypothetical protein
MWSFGVISIAAVAGAEEKLGIGINGGGGHNFQICWLCSCDWFTKRNVGACFRLCRCVQESFVSEQSDSDGGRCTAGDSGPMQQATRTNGCGIHLGHGSLLRKEPRDTYSCPAVRNVTDSTHLRF